MVAVLPSAETRSNQLSKRVAYFLEYSGDYKGATATPFWALYSGGHVGDASYLL